MKKYLLLTFVLFVFLTSNVYAKENIYFTNSSGVEVTELEYNNIKAIHGEEFLDSVDLETFNEYYEFYSCQNLEIEKVESIDFNNQIIPFSDTHSTESKVLSITSAYTPFDKMITINLDWKKAPKIRSYDVFGFRTENVSFNDISVNNNFCGSNTKPSNTKLTNIGYGASIKLPTSCDQISMQIYLKQLLVEKFMLVINMQ